jgi:hypothetical protein
MLANVFPTFCILCVGFPFPAQGTENARVPHKVLKYISMTCFIWQEGKSC